MHTKTYEQKQRDKARRLKRLARDMSNFYYECLAEHQERPFTHNPALGDSKRLAYFIRAADILDHHGATFVDFLNAQIEGLRFIGDEGLFPRPRHLGTDAAELRYLKFMCAKRDVRSGLLEMAIVAERMTNMERAQSMGDNT